jgi:hypothetical protein
MGLLLQILGVIFLLIILFGVVVLLTIRSKLRGFVKELEGLAKTMAVAPSRIHLEKNAEAYWNDPERTFPLIEPLKSLGFEKAGSFHVEEIEGLQLEAWVNPAKSATAVVYEHPSAGIWVDIYTHFEHGTRITFTNSSVGEGLEHAPGHDSRRFPSLGTRELFEKFLAERPDKPARPVSVETFAEVFERVYAEEQDWRNSRGGVTVEEIRAIGASSGDSYDDDVIEATHEFTERHALEELDELIRERFLEETKLSAIEWERVRDRVIVIHDKMNAEMFEDVVGPWVDEDLFEQFDMESGDAPRKLFSEINRQLPENYKFQQLGTVSSPVEADVYAVPED